MKRIELLAPAGSMACLKAAVSRGADSVYLGMRRFNARELATNFNDIYLKDAVKICRANNVNLYLTMNTLVKDSELKDFFEQLSYAYSQGIDAVIIQEISLLKIIKENYPGLRVHISTQAGVMNSLHASLLKQADRINLARELTLEEIKAIRKGCPTELEAFCHGALCASVSGMCLFSSLLGGRSGNRGRCAQPCRKMYNGCYYLSTRDLCLIDELPQMIDSGIASLKIEGRMRSPYYVATATEAYRKAIDSYYLGKFSVPPETKARLKGAFNREFTKGWLASSTDLFNRSASAGKVGEHATEEYTAKQSATVQLRKAPDVALPMLSSAAQKKCVIVRTYNAPDAKAAADAGADIVAMDIFHKDFAKAKNQVPKLYAVTPRIMLDADMPNILALIKEHKPAGIVAGNLGMLAAGLNLPVILDYSTNAFNSVDIAHFNSLGATPVASPELSVVELKQLKGNFAAFVHGKIRLMTLRHLLKECELKDEKGGAFTLENVRNGFELCNGKELGMLCKARQLSEAGIKQFYIDTDTNVKEVVSIYRKVLDNLPCDDSKLKKAYILGWAYRGVE